MSKPTIATTDDNELDGELLDLRKQIDRLTKAAVNAPTSLVQPLNVSPGPSGILIALSDGTVALVSAALFLDVADEFALSAYGAGVKMNKPVHSKLLFAQQSIQGGDTIASTSVETAFATTYNGIAASSLAAGNVIRIVASGIYSTDATASPSLRVKIKLGSVVYLDTQATNLFTNESSKGWRIEASFIVLTTGAGGTAECQGEWGCGSATTSFYGPIANTGTVALDTTVVEAVSITAKHANANVGTSIQMRQLMVELLK